MILDHEDAPYHPIHPPTSGLDLEPPEDRGGWLDSPLRVIAVGAGAFALLMALGIAWTAWRWRGLGACIAATPASTTPSGWPRRMRMWTR